MKQLHPDIATALTSAGQEIPPPPKNGIGKDPRKAYEIAHWTKDEREGHLAYVDSVLNNPTKLEGGVGSAGRVSRLANFWTEKERMKSPKISPSSRSDTGPKNSISELMIALREHSGRQSQKQPVRHTDGQSVTEQHAPKSSVSSHLKFIKDGSFSNQKEPKQSELLDLATRPASGRLISFEAGSAQSESELRPASGQRDRPKESVSSLNRPFEKGDEGESRLVSEQECRQKGSLSSRIRCFEQGAMRAKVAPSLASQRPEPRKGMVSSRVKFFEQGAVCKKDGSEPSEKHDLPKGAVSARINALEANSARQLEERMGQNGKRKPAVTNSRYSISDNIKALKESSTRELEDSRPTIERISRHLSVQEQVEQVSKSCSAGGVILLNEHAAGDDGQVNNYSKPKIDASN